MLRGEKKVQLNVVLKLAVPLTLVAKVTCGMDESLDNLLKLPGIIIMIHFIGQAHSRSH